MSRLIAIGDIHGCFNTLKNLLKRVSYDKSSDTLVLVGDYIDRGNFSYETVIFLQELQREVEDRCICLRGNHEQMVIEASDGAADWRWIRNGGASTIKSYRRHGSSPTDHVDWFKSLPLIYETHEVVFCHAGLAKPIIKDNTDHDILWGRDWFDDTTPREKQVVFGHTPNIGSAYTVSSGDICIDAGCVFGGRLCALIFDNDGSSDFIYETLCSEDSNL